jgi:hypothetical protein
MIKRFFPLALLFAWAPTALAFPPCPIAPVDLDPLGQRSGTVEAWFQASYELFGNPNVIGQLKNTNSPRSKCRDRLPVPDTNASPGAILLTPSFAPLSGFGVISLPEMPAVAEDRLSLQYRLDFTVDNALLANTGDWIDVAQLEFAHDRKQAGSVSAVYRVRKIQYGKGPARLEVIESRMGIAPPNTEPHLPDRIVAEIPLEVATGKTAIALRWTQFARVPLEAPAIQYNIDSVLEVLVRGKDAEKPADYVLYTASLPRQWADTLWMGLLDYNVPDDSQYGSEFRLMVDDTQLSAKAL